jgi:predicted nucleotidyltransferase
MKIMKPEALSCPYDAESNVCDTFRTRRIVVTDARERLVEKIASRLSRFESIDFALLFGSRSGENARPDSDIDVAVHASVSLSKRERFELGRDLSAELADLGKVDIVFLDEAPPLLGHRALQGSVIMKRNPTAYVRYFVKTLAAAEDERYWRELHARWRRSRLEEGAFGRP